MIATRNAILLISAIVVITFITVREATAYRKFDEDLEDSKSLDTVQEGTKLKHKKYQPVEDEKSSFGKRKTVQTIRYRERKRRSISGIDKKINANQNHLGEIKLRKSIVTNEVSSAVNNSSKKEFENAEDNYIDERLLQKKTDRGFSSNDLRSKRNAAVVSVPPLRTNMTEYYAQRKAVMDRFHTRQRQIAAKYTKENSTESPILTTIRPIVKNDAKTESNSLPPLTVIMNKDNIRRENIVNSTSNSLTDYTNYTSTTARIAETTTEVNIVEKINREEELEGSRNTSNVYRDTRDYYDSLNREGENDNSYGTVNDDVPTNEDNDILLWGKCTGKMIYQHNLLLSARGSTFRDGNFIVELSGPICITCIKVSVFQETRATISLDSISRGDSKNYVKLRLRGFQGDNFTYIVKIWAIGKDGRNCDSIK